MTQFTEPAVDGSRIGSPAPPSVSLTSWRVAGGLALGHVVLLFAGFSQGVVVEHGDADGRWPARCAVGAGLRAVGGARTHDDLDARPR